MWFRCSSKLVVLILTIEAGFAENSWAESQPRPNVLRLSERARMTCVTWRHLLCLRLPLAGQPVRASKVFGGKLRGDSVAKLSRSLAGF